MKILASVACMAMAAAVSAQALQDTSTHREPPAPVHETDVLLEWNERALSLAMAEDRLLTLKGVRTAAMMHIAIHDAINSIRRTYDAYTFRADGVGADPIVAAAQAAYEVLLAQYPDHAAQLQADLRGWQGAASSDRARHSAVELGKAAAAAILARREGDGWNYEATYEWQPSAAGVYSEFREHSGTPEGFVFGTGWWHTKPFALRSADQFRVAPPPAIDSDEYAAAFEEVKVMGRAESPARTLDQTHQAMWWKDFVENSHNRLARDLIAAHRLDLWAAARLLALLNISVVDAYISSFESKFFYNHWRPYTAIRWADRDGNARTEPDAQWNNTHRHTYAFPSYPSAHGTACAAAMKVMADTFGDRKPFTMKTPEVDAAGPMSEKIAMEPATRSFDSFAAAAMECAMSRVYLGIHFRYDSIAGNRLGAQVGDYVIQHLLCASDDQRRRCVKSVHGCECR